MMIKLNSASKITMNELLAKALEIKDRCKDILLPGAYTGRKEKTPTGAANPGLTAATVSNEGEYGSLSFFAPISADDTVALSMRMKAKLSSWAFYQLCSVRLGIPHNYMRKCLDSEYEDVKTLWQANVNTHLSHYDRATRIRLYWPDTSQEPVVRGIVTSSYAVFDSDQVLETVQDVLGDGFSVKGYFLNEEGLHLRVTTPEPLAIDGEDLYPGLIISSGDVGNRSLEVSFFIWKQVCTNGLVMEKVSGQVLHKRHLGIYDPADFKMSLTEALEMFPTFCENAKTLVEEARRKELTADMLTERLKAFGKSVKLTEGEENAITVLTTKYGMTLWGFVNALTEFAQAERFDLDNRIEIEAYAGDLITPKAATAA